MNSAIPPEERVDRHYRAGSPTECWVWTSAKDPHGYGRMGLEPGRTGLAHRFMYQLHKGPIPHRYEVDHLCKNPSCVNPSHLEAVPGHVNNARSNSLSAQRSRQTHCMNGHEFTPENTYIYRTQRQCRICRKALRKAYHERTGK